MDHIVVDMFLNYECKGSVRYDDVSQGQGAINAVYISKRQLKQPYPQKIRLTITEREG